MEFINIVLRNIRLTYSYPKIFDSFVIITKFLASSEREKHLRGIRYDKGLLGFKFLCSLVHCKIKIRKVGN